MPLNRTIVYRGMVPRYRLIRKIWQVGRCSPVWQL